MLSLRARVAVTKGEMEMSFKHKPIVVLTGDGEKDQLAIQEALVTSGAPIFQRAGRLVTPIDDRLVPIDAEMLTKLVKEHILCVYEIAIGANRGDTDEPWRLKRLD